jgi:hypothetical protein
MPKKFVAEPASGFRGTWTEEGGRELDGTYTMYGEIYGPDEVPPEPMGRLLQLKAKGLWDPGSLSLKMPFLDGHFVIGPDILRGVPDTAFIRIRINHRSKAQP